MRARFTALRKWLCAQPQHRLPGPCSQSFPQALREGLDERILRWVFAASAGVEGFSPPRPRRHCSLTNPNRHAQSQLARPRRAYRTDRAYGESGLTEQPKALALKEGEKLATRSTLTKNRKADHEDQRSNRSNLPQRNQVARKRDA